MKSIVYLSLVLIGLQAHCHHIPGHRNDQDTHGHQNPHGHHVHNITDCHKIAPSNANFALRFYKQIVSDATAKNAFFSPLSISTAFALLTLGAKSETLNQIYQGLAFNLSETEEKEIHQGFHQLIHMLNRPNNKVQVSIGNALFIDAAFKLLPKFLEDVKTSYEAEGFSTNFSDSTAAEKQMNDYVKNKTHGKISQAVEGLDESIVLVLVNYIFYKADWKEPFSTRLIREEDFFVDADTTVRVNMMSRDGYYKVLYDETLFCSVVEIPYKGDSAAWFILPDKGKLSHVEESLVKEDLSKWETSFKYTEIHLRIPKFSISASYDVKDIFQRLGVIDVFNDNADLSGITGEPNLKVSKAIHKAVVDVNERGTEAAAVTEIEISPRSGGPSTILEFNRPFLMVIVDKPTQSTIFMGKVGDPTQN